MAKARLGGQGRLAQYRESGMATRVVIPADIEFEHLNVRREQDGRVTFDADVIEAILDASDIGDLTEDDVSALVVQWYIVHRRDGGAENTVMEELYKEMRLNDERSQGTSHKPGRA